MAKSIFVLSLQPRALMASLILANLKWLFYTLLAGKTTQRWFISQAPD